MAERRPIIAANWKMHKTHLEAIQAVQKLSYLLDQGDAERVEVVICPPFTALRSVQTLIDSDKLPYGLGAQDVHPQEQGAFTGAVSPLMLQALRVTYVIVGHSERRQLFGEDDALVNGKLRSVLAHGMTPILCVGETLEERDAVGTESTVTQQVRRAFDGVDAEEARSVVIADEPVWCSRWDPASRRSPTSRSSGSWATTRTRNTPAGACSRRSASGWTSTTAISPIA